MKKLLALVAAGMIASVPMTASAVSTLGNISDGDSVDIQDGPFIFTALFGDGIFDDFAEDGDFMFTFTNSGASNTFTVNVATVNQENGEFDGGVDFDFGGDTDTIAQGVSGELMLTAFIPSGGSINFLIDYEDFLGGNGAVADIDFTVAAQVPLPASVLMLLGAVGGLGMLGRRRKDVV